MRNRIRQALEEAEQRKRLNFSRCSNSKKQQEAAQVNPPNQVCPVSGYELFIVLVVTATLERK